MMRDVAMPACASVTSVGSSQYACDVAVGDDGRAHAGPKGCDARAERRQHVAADDDVVGAAAERDVDDHGIGMLQRRGHGAALAMPVACPTAAPTVHSLP